MAQKIFTWTGPPVVTIDPSFIANLIVGLAAWELCRWAFGLAIIVVLGG